MKSLIAAPICASEAPIAVAGPGSQGVGAQLAAVCAIFPHKDDRLTLLES